MKVDYVTIGCCTAQLPSFNATQVQHILLSVTTDSSSIDFKNSDELTHFYGDADMGVENEWVETYFLPVRTLMDFETLAMTGQKQSRNSFSS